MKKTTLLLAFAILFACAVQAQDSTHHNTTTQNHKKAMHRQTSTMTADSVNEGKITTNPNGKTGNKSATVKRRKSTMNSSSNNSTDSAK
jgi:outer membrane biogenesis lipoprotein LolB